MPQTSVEKSVQTAPLAVLFDGHCRFCQAGAERLSRWARPGSLQMIDFQKPGALDPFPGLDHAACMRHMILITPEGRRFTGAEAIVQALTTRGGWTRIGFLYYVPGIRQLGDFLYYGVARIRYYLPGKRDRCTEGTCHL
jgi:predicted DCC family thiol-disulfide oxidoreductase YuxK